MTNSIHVPHPCLKICSCLLNWRLSEGMRLCRVSLLDALARWRHSFLSGRETSKRREEYRGGGGEPSGKMKNEQGEKGKHPQPNATILIWTLLQLFWHQRRLLRWSHPMYVTALNSASWCVFQKGSLPGSKEVGAVLWLVIPYRQPFPLNCWEPATGFPPLMHS